MGKFAFIVHPERAADIKSCLPAVGYLPARVAEVLGRILPPAVLAEIRAESPYGAAEGWLISTRLTTRQMNELPEQVVIRRIIKAGKIAERLGADIIGLGGANTLVFEAISGKFNIPVAGGSGFTVTTVLDSAEEALLLMGSRMQDVHAVVLNATGPAGRACSLILSGKARSMTMVDGNKGKCEELAGKILFCSGMSVKISTNPGKAVQAAQLVVAAPQADIEPEKLLPGSVFCDLTGFGVGQKIAVTRDDVLVIEGGAVKMPGSPGNYSEEGLPPGLIDTRLAETIMLAMENSSGKKCPESLTGPEQVDGMRRLALKHGFSRAGLKGPGGILKPDQLERIRLNAQKKIFAAV